jgi:hypothetical protein
MGNVQSTVFATPGLLLPGRHHLGKLLGLYLNRCILLSFERLPRLLVQELTQLLLVLFGHHLFQLQGLLSLPTDLNLVFGDTVPAEGAGGEGDPLDEAFLADEVLVETDHHGFPLLQVEAEGADGALAVPVCVQDDLP